MTTLILIAALLAAAFLGWPLTALVLRLARSVDARPVSEESVLESADSPQAELPAVRQEAVSATPVSAAPEPLTEAKVLRGGLLIGILERLAVVLCIVFDQPVAIAYVIAVKGLGRYPELKESPAASERFIIGTLASLIWATLVGILARWFIAML
ncbi:hypothetical protein FHU41_002936 [Psychromicrobium silvestre]|uniref:Uncharacterized protein n=1 Tax=Psychromicrobium silvestre TaxID=1645614 RepID=A0A7Y9LW60_9MICC|nr:hypothetical protein [Psychromicrobium silvestre]NYE96686.1 hypothetical protein [Psychromicrobium silvestre]